MSQIEGVADTQAGDLPETEVVMFPDTKADWGVVVWPVEAAARSLGKDLLLSEGEVGTAVR